MSYDFELTEKQIRMIRDCLELETERLEERTKRIGRTERNDNRIKELGELALLFENKLRG